MKLWLRLWYCDYVNKIKFNEIMIKILEAAAQEENDKARIKVLQNPSKDNKRILAQKQRNVKRL